MKIKQVNKSIRRLSIGTIEGFVLLDFDSINYLLSDNNYTIFYLTNNSKFVASKNIGYFEKRLQNDVFIRIHNTIIVNFSKVIKYRNDDGGRVILFNNKSLPVSRSRKKLVLEAFKRLC